MLFISWFWSLYSSCNAEELRKAHLEFGFALVSDHGRGGNVISNAHLYRSKATRQVRAVAKGCICQMLVLVPLAERYSDHTDIATVLIITALGH